MARPEYQPLTESDLAALPETAPGWQVVNGQLSRSFDLPTYAEGLVLAVACGRIADQLDHHPDLLITYRKVNVTISTHFTGGLSQLDLEFARRVNALV